MAMGGLVGAGDADAAQLGFAQGEIVTLESRRGTIDLPVWLSGRGHPPQGSALSPSSIKTC